MNTKEQRAHKRTTDGLKGSIEDLATAFDAELDTVRASWEEERKALQEQIETLKADLEEERQLRAGSNDLLRSALLSVVLALTAFCRTKWYLRWAWCAFGYLPAGNQDFAERSAESPVKTNPGPETRQEEARKVGSEDNEAAE